MSRTRGDGQPAERGKRPSTFVLSQVLTRWTLLALIVMVPIIVMPGFTYDVFNVPKFGVLVIGISIALALHVFGVITGFAPPIPRGAWVVPLAIFVPLLISWVFSPNQEWALFGQYSRLQGLIPYALFGIFSVLVVANFRGRERQLAWALAGAGGLVGIGLLLSMMGVSATGAASQSGTLGNSNYVGGFLGITLPLGVHVWLTARDRSYAAMAMTVLNVTGLILSYSQGGQAAGLAGVSLLVGFHIGRPWTRRLSLGVAAVIAVGVVALVALNYVRPVGGYTALTRSQAWSTAFAMGLDSPLVGSGPNALALEAPRFRSLEDAFVLSGFVAGYVPIGIEYQTTDDPHSIPLSFFANAGLIGLAGVIVAWGWTIWRGLARADDAVGVAFFAATVAYFVQALVSIDELSLRLVFWTAVAGLVAATARSPERRTREPGGSSVARGAIGGLVAATLALSGIAYGTGFIRADHQVRSGRLLFEDGAADDGAAAIRSALAFRDEALYREVLAGMLGLEGLEAGEDGQRLIDEMREVNAYLADLPDVGAIHAYARIMSYWGHYQPAGYDVALALFGRAGRLDPVNPLIKVETAEVLVDLGRLQEALALLEPLSRSLEGRVPEYWASLAITRLEAGDVEGAREAFAHADAVDPGDCRVGMADALLTVEIDGPPEEDLADDLLNLRLNCADGLYNMLLRRLPQDVRARYD